MNLKINRQNEQNKKKLLGGQKNVILIIIIILSFILFFIILWTMIKSIKKSTPTTNLISNINLTETVDKFLYNLSITTKIDDKIKTDKIINLIKTDKVIPTFFVLAENYYLQIPKSQL